MNILSDILKEQTVHGAFPSKVKMRDNLIAEDENVFITVLVLFELMRQEKTPEVCDAISRGLDFVEACEVKPFSGIFRFYPSKLPSAKLNIPLYPDLDDSALSILILLYSGRRDEEWAYTVLPDVFETNRLLYTNGHPAWIKAGAFKTWFGDNHDNPVDCCVNINVLALYAYLGLNRSNVYKTALQSVKQGIKSSGLDHLHMRQLAPFYAHPLEVYECIKRAVHFGAIELAGERNAFQHLESYRTDGINHPVCCNDWGQPLWFSSTLQKARTISELIPN